MKLGIIGKSQSGKTTLFNAASGHQESVGDFSKTMHRAQIRVPDDRVDTLAELISPKKITFAQIEFLDAPGVSGGGKETVSFEISDELRQADAFVMVIDAFSEQGNPEKEMAELLDELILADNVQIETNLERRKRKAKLTGDKSAAQQIGLLEKCLKALNDETSLLDCEFDAEEQKTLRGYQFLSMKPLLIVLNISEDKIGQAESILAQYEKLAKRDKRELAAICGKIEMDLVTLDEDERQAFMSELGISTPAMDVVLQKSYSLLGLISYLTAAEPEVRAWTISRGMTAQRAAGVIHSDIERGFIRAEVTSYDDYISLRTPAAIKAAGKQRLEGKEYIVADGDVILFRFNV